MNFTNWGLTGTVQPTQSKGIMEEVMRSGNVPIAGKMGVVGGGGVVPPTLLDEARVPKFYLDAITACGATNSSTLPHTALVYNLMVTSGLPRPVLSYIWSAVNRSLPGQLTRPEFFSCLALIALAQRGESLVALSEMGQLPIPHLQTFTVSSSMTPASSTTNTNNTTAPHLEPVAPVAVVRPPPTASNPVQRPQQIPNNSTASPSKSRFIPSAFIPSSLLPRWSEKAAPPSSASSSTTPAAPQSAKKSTQVPSNTLTAGGGDTSSASVSKTSQESTAISTDVGARSADLSSLEWNLGLDGPKTSQIPEHVEDRKNEDHHRIRSSAPVDGSTLETWVKILTAASSILEAADKLLTPNTVEVLKEVADTEKGRAYFECLEKADSIIKRILSLSASGVEMLPPEVKDRASRADAIWTRLDGFHLYPEENLDKDELWSCAICTRGICRHTKVDYGGHQYHSECANLWVNCVAPIFPITS